MIGRGRIEPHCNFFIQSDILVIEKILIVKLIKMMHVKMMSGFSCFIHVRACDYAFNHYNAVYSYKTSFELF